MSKEKPNKTNACRILGLVFFVCMLTKANTQGLSTVVWFCGTEFCFENVDIQCNKLESCSEADVSVFLERLEAAGFREVAETSLHHKREAMLCDWAFVRFTHVVAGHFLGPKSNEATLLQFYLLRHAGFGLRLAKTDKQLFLLAASEDELFQRQFVEDAGRKFYLTDTVALNQPLLMFKSPISLGRPLSLAVGQPKLDFEPTEARVLASRHHPETKAEVRTNRNLIAYYAMLPKNAEWYRYKEASLSDEAKTALYPVLREAMKGKDEIMAVNMLLDFVQSALAYLDDRQQFGHERPLFPDETLFYPYSDCDDRAILFACLVEELTSLETLFLKYPNHIAVGVAFSQAVEGDTVEHEGKRYLVCDPTCIGATVGQSPNKHKNNTPIVAP
ncbi:MAG: hypothetical protein IJQ11_14500 [Bacteroidales bacterium]|nr:hypothetical protein [Bacteroidales bacterium]